MAPRAARRRVLAVLGLAAMIAGGCGPVPPSYELVGMVRAHELLLDPGLAVVHVLDPETDAPGLPTGGLRWNPATEDPPTDALHDAPVLLIGPSDALAHRGAAALARTRNQRVYVCIARSAEERSSLYARVREIEEVPGGRDS